MKFIVEFHKEVDYGFGIAGLLEVLTFGLHGLIVIHYFYSRLEYYSEVGWEITFSAHWITLSMFLEPSVSNFNASFFSCPPPPASIYVCLVAAPSFWLWTPSSPR